MCISPTAGSDGKEFACNAGSEKAMVPHSSTLAWKIPWAEEPGRLQSMGSLRVGHDWATSLSLFTFMHWRRKWQPTPVFLPGESQGQEPGRLPSMGSHRVGHDWSDLAAAAIQDTWVQSLGWKDPLKKGIGYSLLYSCLDNSMNRGTQWATVHRVAKCRTQLSNSSEMYISPTANIENYQP